MQRSGGLLSYGAGAFDGKEGRRDRRNIMQSAGKTWTVHAWQMIFHDSQRAEYEDQYRFLWLSAALMLGGMIAVIVIDVISSFRLLRRKAEKAE